MEFCGEYLIIFHEPFLRGLRMERSILILEIISEEEFFEGNKNSLVIEGSIGERIKS